MELVFTALTGAQRRPPALMRRHSPSGERGFFFALQILPQLFFVTFRITAHDFFPAKISLSM